jgi:hypothetical protein
MVRTGPNADYYQYVPETYDRYIHVIYNNSSSATGNWHLKIDYAY